MEGLEKFQEAFAEFSDNYVIIGDQLEELYQIGRTGALSFSFEDHSLEDHLV